MFNTLLKTKARSSYMLFVALVLALQLTACSSPEEKAQKYYEKGMALLEDDQTEKAKIEFKNALQIKKNMNPAIYGMALAFEKEGDWQKVFGLLTQVVEQDPKHVQALIKLGNLYLASGKLDKAVDTSEKLKAIDANASEVLSYNAAVLLKSGDTVGALEKANLALQKNPANTEAVVVLASERIVAKDLPKAISYLDQGLAKDPKNVGLYMMKVAALDDANELAKAEEVYHKVIEMHPEKRAFRKALAAFYLKHNEVAKAEAALRKIVELEPKDFKAKMDVVSLVNATKGVDGARKELEKYAAESPKDNELKFAQYSLYMKQNDRQAAEKVLSDIIEKSDKNEDILKAKGYLASKYLAEAQRPKAVKLIEEILGKDPRNEQALLLKAGLNVSDKKYDAAIAHLRTILSDSPNSSRALLALGKAHELSGAAELADEHYAKALQASKLGQQYAAEYSQFLLRRNQATRAEQVLEDALSVHPGDISLLRLLARAKIVNGDWVGAQSVAERIKQSSNNPELAEQVMGAIFAGQKNYTDSIAAFKRAYEAAPDNAQPLAGLVRTYMLAGKSNEAVAFLKSITEKNPQNLAAQMMLAQIYQELKDGPAAIQAYEKVLAQNAKASQAYQQLAILYSNTGNQAKAAEVVNKGLSVNPKDLNLLYIRAGVLETEHQYNEAIAIYEQLLTALPEAELILNNLASLLADNRTSKEDLDRAYQLAQKLAKSESPFMQDTVGWTAYKVGKYGEAQSALQQATNKMPTVAVFHYHLGKAYHAMLNKADAKKSLNKALELSKTGGGSVPEDDIKKLLAEIG